MTQIDELHGRITRALDRISQQVEGYTAPVAEADPEAADKVNALEAALAAAQEQLIAAQDEAKAAQVEANVSREAAAAEAEKARVAQDETATLTEQLAAAKEAVEAAQAAAEAQVAEDIPVDETPVEEPAVAAADPSVDPAEIEALREELEDEKMANAQLQERLSVLTARQNEGDGDTAGDADLTHQLKAQREAMSQLDAELQRLRSSNAALEETVTALREANAQGVGEPHLINKAMLAELENLRASQAADAAETNVVLAAMEPLLAEAAGEENV